MCYNAPVSFSTFFIGISIAIYLYQRNLPNDRWNAMFITSFIFIQLIEGFIWINNFKTNNIIPYLILITLICQPLSQIYGLLQQKYISNKTKIFFKYAFIIGFILSATALISLSPQKTKTGPCGHIDWNLKFNNKIIQYIYFSFYLIFLGLPLIFMKPYYKGITLLSYGIFSFIAILIIYSAKEFSSMWCFVAIIYAILATTL